ncbi:uncharacterized protein LOC119076365 [Bradysia coprophila]|uniref:uncharacterized protein LOC119076365 n=1 Tax=Bradysia coprophila TaxID=38358 RepID=UPI00187D903A|nr:uncharacterized protein LOC119076365 [Bradysia coprophila]
MNEKELNISNIVGELVKNSVDAQCNVVQVDFNGSFDFRVIDDGCGFDENVMQDIGERQVFQSQPLQKNRFRYGKHGKFLLKVARGAAAEIFIESIRHNSDVRLYKSIIANKSSYKIYKTDRSDKDALVATAQGSMVVLNTLNLNIDDAARLKSNIVNTVVDLSLVNFEVDISVRDTATQQTLYASYRTKNLFDKFEQFLESHQFFSKIQSVSCEKHDVKVELLLCEDATSSKTFQFVYFNKLIEYDGKWRKFINKLCKNRFENDLNATCPVYLMNIFAENYLDNQLAYNVIVDNCIRKCVEQLLQPPANRTSISHKSISKAVVPNNDIATTSKDPPDNNGKEAKGIGLGDYIFNNSCENYEQLNLGKDVYRKKICENWIISLDKPKPKDLANDSLQSVVINRSTTIQPDDHLFKKPKPKSVKSRRGSQKMVTKIKPAPQSSTQIYKPSQHVRVFNNSSLLRASKKLIAKTSTDVDLVRRKNSRKKVITKTATVVDRVKRKDSTKNRNGNRFELKEPVSDTERHSSNKKPSNDLNLSPMDALPNDTFENPNDQNNEPNHELRDAFKAPVYFAATQKTLDFRWNQQTTNFNMNFSSSIAIRTINEDDSFMHFLGNDVGENNSMKNLFESIEQPANATPTRSESQMETCRMRTQLQTDTHRTRTQIPQEMNRPSGSSVYSQTSEFRYRHHRNNSVRAHYRRRTSRSFVSDNSLNSQRSGRSSGASIRSDRSKSIKPAQSSTQTATTTTAVAPMRKPNSQIDLLSDNGLKAGWPVTININFGGQPQC